MLPNHQLLLLPRPPAGVMSSNHTQLQVDNGHFALDTPTHIVSTGTRPVAVDKAPTNSPQLQPPGQC